MVLRRLKKTMVFLESPGRTAKSSQPASSAGPRAVTRFSIPRREDNLRHRRQRDSRGDLCPSDGLESLSLILELLEAGLRKVLRTRPSVAVPLRSRS